MTDQNQEKYKIILIFELLFIILLEGAIFFAPQVRTYLNLRQINSLNAETLREVETAKIERTEQTSEVSSPNSAEAVPSSEITSSGETTIIPRTSQTAAYLEVPFICQAPLETEENWTFHEESCEEAALLMSYLFESGERMSKEEANEEILRMIEWQKENFGAHKDIYAEDVKKLAMGFYQIPAEKIEVISDATIEDIKKIVAGGDPVIVPITGEILNNPYYPYPGYHMLTVIGFTEDRIITNDNGTRHGKDFSYDIATFQAAMEDAGSDIVVLKF